jgi:molybdate transport system permease protein
MGGTQNVRAEASAFRLIHSMDVPALFLTLRLAAFTTMILLVLAIPIAWWIASGTGLMRATAQAVVALPLVLPPTVLGFYLLVALGPLTAPGRLIIHLLGHPLAFSFSGLLLGSLIYSLPFAVQPLVAGFIAVDPTLFEASLLLGASPSRTFRSIVLPLSRPSLITAAVLTFTHTVGEFGVVLMLGGNIPGATRTLSIALYDQVQNFDYAAANRTAVILVVVAFGALALIYSRRQVGRLV